MTPATSAPPTPTAIVIPMLMGFGPGMARRPSAPTMSPVSTSARRNPITAA
jgi:hypothetical protein